MKYFILGLLLALTSTAHATKARVAALSFAGHLTDEQYIYSDALYTNYLGNFISLETGASTSTSATTTTSNAEGMIGYKINPTSTVVVSVGHQDDMVVFTRSFMNSLGTAYDMTQNPIHLFYGSKPEGEGAVAWALGLEYSDYKNKVTDAKESSAGLNLGVEVGAWQFYGTYIFTNKVETAAANEFDGSGALSVNTYYTGEKYHAYLTVIQGKAKSSTAGVDNESHDLRTIYLGILQTEVKDGNDLFWGAQLVSRTADCKIMASATCDTSYSSLSAPVWIGFEAEASPWLVLRGSITQPVLIHRSKDEVPYPADTFDQSTGALSDIGVNSDATTVAAGAGLRFNKFTIDGTLVGAQNQNLNLFELFTQVGLKYNY